jgi:uncharacterized protein (DUF1330 family)
LTIDKETTLMSTYAIAHVQSVNLVPEIVEYLQRIDATLAPYGGRFLVHGDPADVREGDFGGDVIVIEFADRGRAVGWYESHDYREILTLRTENTTGWVVLVDGVPADHSATDVLSASPANQ